MLEWKEITICFHGQTYLAKGELKGDAGEIVGILGESGCGKSALLNVLSGVDRENCCLLWEEGRPLKSDEKSRRCFRRERLAYVTQNVCLPGGKERKSFPAHMEKNCRRPDMSWNSAYSHIMTGKARSMMRMRKVSMSTVPWRICISCRKEIFFS